jgi:hypothetical protein
MTCGNSVALDFEPNISNPSDFCDIYRQPLGNSTWPMFVSTRVEYYTTDMFVEMPVVGHEHQSQCRSTPPRNNETYRTWSIPCTVHSTDPCNTCSCRRNWTATYLFIYLFIYLSSIYVVCLKSSVNGTRKQTKQMI